jgi:hypothetical protein
MTPAEEIEARRKDRVARLNDAWADLAASPSFRLVMEDAQIHFGMFKESFLPTDGFNPHAAAQRDGQKSVLAHFARRIARGVALTEDEAVSKPTSAL